MDIAKWFFIGGFILLILGGLIWLGVPIGRLPGDFYYKGENTHVYIPLTTSILISVALSLFFWLISST